MVPADVRSILGVRGGLYYNSFAITDYDHGTAGGGLGIGDGGVIADDGTRFGSSVDNYQSPFYNTKAVSNMTMFGFYAGICKAQYFNVSVNASGYGNKANRSYIKYFADIILAPPVIQDFKTATKSYKVQGGNAQGFETRPFGARVGVDVVKFGKAIAMNFRTEFGMKPGFQSSKYYLATGFGISYRGKIKLFSPADDGK